MSTTQLKPHIRWCVRRDMAEVLETEQLCFQFPWREDQFISVLRRRNCIGMVAAVGTQVAGHMLYEIGRTGIHLLNFAVHPSCQRRGIGRAMLEKLIGKLSTQQRCRLVMEVRETNLDAQLFFRAMGCKAVAVLEDYYDDVSEDALLFEYFIGRPPAKLTAATADCGEAKP